MMVLWKNEHQTQPASSNSPETMSYQQFRLFGAIYGGAHNVGGCAILQYSKTSTEFKMHTHIYTHTQAHAHTHSHVHSLTHFDAEPQAQSQNGGFKVSEILHIFQQEVRSYQCVSSYS